MRNRAWTYLYEPFRLGGSVWQANGFEFQEADAEAVDLGKGYSGFRIVSPNGKEIIVEKTSGAIVGSSLTDVRKDIEVGDDATMKKQVEKALYESVTIISPEEFWRVYEKSR